MDIPFDMMVQLDAPKRHLWAATKLMRGGLCDNEMVVIFNHEAGKFEVWLDGRRRSGRLVRVLGDLEYNDINPELVERFLESKNRRGECRTKMLAYNKAITERSSEAQREYYRETVEHATKIATSPLAKSKIISYPGQVNRTRTHFHEI